MDTHSLFVPAAAASLGLPPLSGGTLRAATLYDRTIPTSGAEGGEINSLNMLFIVAFAVGIAFLAQWIIRRGGRRR